MPLARRSANGESMRSLDDFAEAKLKGLAARQLDRSLIPTRRQDGVWVERGGQLLMSFSCNDYLGLSHHPDVKAAACAAVQSYGAGAGASRLVTGDHPLISALETRLARMKQTEAACVFGSGYLANAGILPTLVGSDDLLLVDELAHACIWAGAKLSGAVVLSFRHNDMDHLAALLAGVPGAHDLALVATDTVFSMDGDLAPLDQLIPLCLACTTPGC